MLVLLEGSNKELDLPRICAMLKDYQMIPIGIQGLNTEDESKVQEVGLAIWPKSTTAGKITADEPNSDEQLKNNWTNHVVVNQFVLECEFMLSKVI